jgi:hypothetical protein
MQTAAHDLDAGHRKARWLAAAPRALAGRIHALAISAIEKAWVAMGQPSPVAGFALLVMVELGRGLLRLPAVQAVVGALSRGMLVALAALAFLYAADRQGQARGMTAAAEAKRPTFIRQALCDINCSRSSSGYHSASRRSQPTPQHQPRRTS